jgi:dihydrofolate reductase
MPRFRIEGHAIVSADDRIADRAGRMPASLRNDADWTYFQSRLDEAAIVVTGRLGHEAHPNKPGRLRLVFTRASGETGFRRDGDLAFIDPARADLFDAFGVLAPRGGVVAVTGGTQVFDHFAVLRLFDVFHLARAANALIPEGRPLFASGGSAAVLEAAGLRPVETIALDPPAGVSLTIHRRLRETPP